MLPVEILGSGEAPIDSSPRLASARGAAASAQRGGEREAEDLVLSSVWPPARPTPTVEVRQAVTKNPA